MKLFNFKNKSQGSIYKDIIRTNFDIDKLKALKLSDGEYEYRIVSGKEKINSISTRPINNALDNFYANEKSSLKEFDDFFKSNRALEAENPFLTNLLQKIEFSEDRLLGLSILLMRDSQIEESVKFGMLLSKYYDLRNYNKVEKIFIDLMSHPAFVYYGLDYLMTVDYSIIDEIYKNSFYFAKQIIEEKVWI